MDRRATDRCVAPAAARTSTRRASSSTSIGPRRTPAGWPTARPRAGWPCGRTSRPTRASPSPGSSSTPAPHGITVGTLGEAEVMAAGGIDDVFIAYPVWADGPKADRLAAASTADVAVVGVDSVAGARAPGGGRRRPSGAAAGARRDRLGRAAERRRRARRRRSRSRVRARDAGLDGDRRLHPRRPRLPRARRRAGGGRRRGRDARRGRGRPARRRLRRRADQRGLDADRRSLRRPAR